jgi:hypothetical protein
MCRVSHVLLHWSSNPGIESSSFVGFDVPIMTELKPSHLSDTA